MKDNSEPLYVTSDVWRVLLKIEDMRVRERRLIRKLWRDLREDTTQRIHKMVFEQALQSNSAFPKVTEKELDNWITENISAVFIALIEQGDIIVKEDEPSKWKEAGTSILSKLRKIASSKAELEEETSEN
ncbi:MAG: hypothetical protein ACXAC6_11865 [Candidatus Hodarchaeales archaeon]|jgi:hypothetical protein